MKELATVLLPTYNGQKYIGQMLDSIYQQDYRPIQLLITDDASTDDTVLTIRSWIRYVDSSDFTVKLMINKGNKGISGNVSGAVRYVQGRYLFLADQDDVWVKDKISRQITYLETNKDCVMCICDKSIINAYSESVCPSIFRYIHADLGKWNYKKVMQQPAIYAANCICLRTEYLHSIFPIPMQIYSHDTFITVMAAHYGKIGFMRSALTQYRIHESNLSGQYALEINKNLLKAGYVVYRALRRKKKAENNDILIIKRELLRRFNEDSGKYLENICGNKVGYIFVDTIRYLFENRHNWKRFCK